MIPDGYSELAPGKIASIVTYLEMTERPWKGATLSAGVVRLKQVKKPELDWYRALFRRAGAQWLWFSRLTMGDEQLKTVLICPATELFLAEAEAGEIGMAELDRSKTPDVEITSFALFPEAIGKGLGRTFMTALLELAWDGPVKTEKTKRVWLHTCTLDSPAALGFYMKCGFRPYKRAVEVADDPRLRGVLPEGAAPQVPIIR
jgi:GNAT superfamily N-acetyltransferase